MLVTIGITFCESRLVTTGIAIEYTSAKLWWKTRQTSSCPRLSAQRPRNLGNGCWLGNRHHCDSRLAQGFLWFSAHAQQSFLCRQLLEFVLCDVILDNSGRSLPTVVRPHWCYPDSCCPLVMGSGFLITLLRR